MKKTLTLIGLALAASAFAAMAQDTPATVAPAKSGKHAKAGKHQPKPLMAALDANGDKEIDAQEIANASTALLTLDKNGDGKLTADELHPAKAGGAAGAGKGKGKHHNPLMAALDANGDGVIDAQEIANAPTALKALDKNNDGKITRDELRPGGEGKGRKHGKKNGGETPAGPAPATL